MRPREIFDTALSLMVIGLCAVLLWQGRGHWTRAQAAPQPIVSAPARVQSGPAYTPMTWGAGPVVDEVCAIGAMSFVVCAPRVAALKPVTYPRPPADDTPVSEVKVKGKPDIKDRPPPVKKKPQAREWRDDPPPRKRGKRERYW